MANFTNNVITVSGLRLMSDCLALGTGIEFTHFGIGDGALPSIPANQEDLVHHLFNVSVSRTMASAHDEGTAIVEGTYTNTAECGDFYEREIGTYARPAGTDIEPVLFSYQHAGDHADYIPTVGVGSVIRQSISVSIAVGSADVLYTADPLGQVSRAEIEQAKNDMEMSVSDVENRLNEFSENKAKEISAQMDETTKKMQDAQKALDRVSDGFVSRTGDTMTGELTAPAFNGDLHGSAERWSGWTLYHSIDSISQDLSASSTIDAVCSAMETPSMLILSVSEPCAFAPADSGVLEIRKTDGAATAQMSAVAGLVFTASMSANGKFSPWYSAIGAQPGQGSFTFADTAPIGYLMAHGQRIKRDEYPALFAAIGTTYNADGDNDSAYFRLPDTRGMFLRGFDSGRGIDAGRKFATEQTAAVPNISGTLQVIHTNDNSEITNATGAFRGGEITNKWGNGYAGLWSYTLIDIDATRSSTVYNKNVNEARPVNLAVNYIIKY